MTIPGRGESLRRRAAVIVVATALVAVTACNSASDAETAAPSATSTAGTPSFLTAPPEPTQGQPAPPQPEVSTFSAGPDAAQTTELLDQLETVVPGIADDEELAVANARETCIDIAQGQDDASTSSNAGGRFAAPGLAAITDVQAREIVQAVRDSFCHG